MKTANLLLCSATLISKISFTKSEVVGAYVLPHGGIALNPSHFRPESKWARQWAWQIHRAAVQVGKHIRRLKPSLILLSTPHGVADLRRFAFYTNANGSGSAQTDNCRCPPCCYEVSNVNLAGGKALEMAGELEEAGHAVTGFSFFGAPGSDEAATLKWGEVIPLLFVKDLSRSEVLVLSQPSRRYNHSVPMIPELVRLGSALFDKLDALPERVVVLVSGDLAHTHQKNGPYGFSPAAKPFDKAMGAWASTLHPYYLLDAGAQLERDAQSCGFTGFVLLHGLLARAGLHQWTPSLLANYHPSYYGMMVASFERKPSADPPGRKPCPTCDTNRPPR